MDEINSLSQQLSDKIKSINNSDPDLAVMEAIHLVRHTLTAALASIQDVQALLDKETLPPDQNTWMETAEQMGVKCIPKCHLPPNEIGLTH